MDLIYTYNNTDRWSVTKSLVVKRPGFNIVNPSVLSGFMPSALYYSICDEGQAWGLLYKAKNFFKDVPSYRYDMVDVTR